MMPAQRKRVKVGDVLQLKVEGRFAYLHFIGTHPEYGGAVVVNPQFREEPATVSSGYFSGGYVTFYPVTAAVAQGLVEVVAHLPPSSLPERLRRAGARSGRHVVTWVIETGSGEVVRTRLSDEERRLPIAAIWNHELLVQRIAEGWNPAQEGRGGMNDDGHVIRELAVLCGGDVPHAIRHYLYVPTREAAAQVSKELRARGYGTEERLGADGVNWLVLVRHEAVPTEQLMASMRRSMEALVAMVGGEYDGWDTLHRS